MQNGVVESRHRRIIEKDLALMFQTKVVLVYWHYAIRTVVFLLNHLPSKSLKGKPSNELLYYKQAYLN